MFSENNGRVRNGRVRESSRFAGGEREQFSFSAGETGGFSGGETGHVLVLRRRYWTARAIAICGIDKHDSASYAEQTSIYVDCIMCETAQTDSGVRRGVARARPRAGGLDRAGPPLFRIAFLASGPPLFRIAFLASGLVTV